MVPMGLLRGYWQRVMEVCTGKHYPSRTLLELIKQRSDDHRMSSDNTLNMS